MVEFIEGYIDGRDGTRLYGWAWHPETPEKLAIVELVAGDRVIAATVADRLRKDLIPHGKREGYCGFEFLIADHIPVGVPLLVRVHTSEGTQNLGGDPVTLEKSPDIEKAVPVSNVIYRERPAPAPERPVSFTPPCGLGAASGIAGHLDCFGPDMVSGWAWWPDDVNKTVSLSFYADDHLVSTIMVDKWRRDLAELRQGDGRCGFDFPVPDALRDGQLHKIDIRLAGTRLSVLPRLLDVQMEVKASSGPGVTEDTRQVASVSKSSSVTFSVIVNFYNMKREAERTLTSLSRAYQRDVKDLNYEVLCIDNGSNPPLDKAWVESFGPEFRLIRPSPLLPSPCNAINQAANEAKGEYLAIMIDGAHVITPGVFRETLDAIKARPGAVVALRHWFIGGDQRWLSVVEYTREMEDKLFSRIDWPSDGYELFRIGTTVTESPNFWFDGMSESNCLFMPATLYQQLGGMDEGFSIPGGGFCNLDLFVRANAASGQSVVCLIGEASFHQFHGGTTTNVSDEEKETRVRSYANTYQELRGKAFNAVSPPSIHLQGRIRSNAMATSRQRPLFTAELGVTERIRPGRLHQHFDTGAQAFVQSVYAECGLYDGTTWKGRKIRLAPADLINIQSILHRVRPASIITTTRDEGLLHYLDSILGALGLEAVRIILVSENPPPADLPVRVQPVVGNPYAEATLKAVDRLVGADEDIVVLFAPRDDDYLPVRPISIYSRYVTQGSYFVFLGTVFGQPWLGYSRYWFATALRAFLEEDNSFRVDKTLDQHLVSLCALGYLQRVGGQDGLSEHDPLLDYFEPAEEVR